MKKKRRLTEFSPIYGLCIAFLVFNESKFQLLEKTLKILFG